MNNNQIFEKIYLNKILTQSYHRKPITGWSKDSFQKIIINMLIKGMKSGITKGKLVKQFDNFFIDSSVFSFKNIFKKKPSISTAGSSKNLHVIFDYSYGQDSDEHEKLQDLLIGHGQVEVNKKKRKKIKNNKQGLIYNRQFFNKFKELVSVNTSLDEDDEQYLDDAQNNQDGNENAIREKLIHLFRKNSVLFKIYLSFQKLNYVKLNNNNQKEFLNPNRVQSYSGKITFTFTINGKPVTFQVTQENNGIEWFQHRTSNMEPPTPIKDQLKRIWNNPQEGSGLIGLASKKLGSGIKNTLFGSVASKTVQEEYIDINFKDQFSKNNMTNITPDPDNNKKNTQIDNIIAELKNCGDMITNVSFDSDTSTFFITLQYEDLNIAIIKVKMKT